MGKIIEKIKDKLSRLNLFSERIDEDDYLNPNTEAGKKLAKAIQEINNDSEMKQALNRVDTLESRVQNRAKGTNGEKGEISTQSKMGGQVPLVSQQQKNQGQDKTKVSEKTGRNGERTHNSKSDDGIEHEI